jgi:G3E family GTPase
MDHPTPVDLIILTGFLGSGKTSLLVDFLRGDDAGDTGVIVNEAGEIGVDGAIVADGSEGVPMTLLANGCVCCSLRSGLVDTVYALLNAPRPGGRPLTRIILETSGLSRPGPIIASLVDPQLMSRGLRLSVVTAYDCSRGPLGDEQFEEACAQFAAAQRIVLTKTDLVPADDIAMHAARAQALNPLAEVVAQGNRHLAVEHAFAVLPGASATDLAIRALRAVGAAGETRNIVNGMADHAPGGMPGNAASSVAGQGLRHPRIKVWRGTVREPMAWSTFSTWLDDLAGLCGDRLLRLKALLRVTDCPEPVLIQSVGTTFGMPRRMASLDGGQDVLIVITRDLDAAALRELVPDAPVVLEACT